MQKNTSLHDYIQIQDEKQNISHCVTKYYGISHSANFACLYMIPLFVLGLVITNNTSKVLVVYIYWYEHLLV